MSTATLTRSFRLRPRVSSLCNARELAHSVTTCRIAVEDPATGTTIAHCDAASPEQVSSAIKAAQEAFDSGVWSRRAPADRAAVVRRTALVPMGAYLTVKSVLRRCPTLRAPFRQRSRTSPSSRACKPAGAPFLCPLTRPRELIESSRQTLPRDVDSARPPARVVRVRRRARPHGGGVHPACARQPAQLCQARATRRVCLDLELQPSAAHLDQEARCVSFARTTRLASGWLTSSSNTAFALAAGNSGAPNPLLNSACRR